jgi:hypothetical protein
LHYPLEVERTPTDTAFIDTHLKQVTNSQGYDIVGARKAGITVEEVVSHIARKNKAEFDTNWSRILLIVGSLYIAISLSVIALSLIKKAKGP